MNTSNKKHKIVCLCCWLTFSPLFFYFSKRWNLLGMVSRWSLLLVSPLFLFIYLCIVCGISWQQFLREQEMAMLKIDIEANLPKIIKTTIAKFKIAEYDDVNYKAVIEFEEELADSTYLILDSLSASHSNWYKYSTGDIYHYKYYNGMLQVVPKKYDIIMIDLETGSNLANITFNEWYY